MRRQRRKRRAATCGGPARFYYRKMAKSTNLFAYIRIHMCHIADKIPIASWNAIRREHSVHGDGQHSMKKATPITTTPGWRNTINYRIVFRAFYLVLNALHVALSMAIKRISEMAKHAVFQFHAEWVHSQQKLLERHFFVAVYRAECKLRENPSKDIQCLLLWFCSCPNCIYLAAVGSTYREHYA